MLRNSSILNSSILKMLQLAYPIYPHPVELEYPELEFPNSSILKMGTSLRLLTKNSSLEPWLGASDEEF